MFRWSRLPPLRGEDSESASVGRAGREAFDRVLMEVLQGVTSGRSARDIVEETYASLEADPQGGRSTAREEGPLRGQDGGASAPGLGPGSVAAAASDEGGLLVGGRGHDAQRQHAVNVGTGGWPVSGIDPVGGWVSRSGERCPLQHGRSVRQM